MPEQPAPLPTIRRARTSSPVAPATLARWASMAAGLGAASDVPHQAAA